MQKPSPIPLAMVICDNVIEDKKTSKKSLIGIFNNISVSDVPCSHYKMCVFVTLTQGIGEYEAKLRCLRTRDNKVLLEGKNRITFANRKQRIDLNLEFRGLKFPDFGEYRFELLCDEKLITARNFNIKKSENRPGRK